LLNKKLKAAFKQLLDFGAALEQPLSNFLRNLEQVVDILGRFPRTLALSTSQTGSTMVFHDFGKVL